MRFIIYTFKNNKKSIRSYVEKFDSRCVTLDVRDNCTMTKCLPFKNCNLHQEV